MTDGGYNFLSSPLHSKGANAEILVCGFIGSVPVIAGVAVGGSGKPSVYFRHTFRAAGSGHAVAETFLNIRNCKPKDQVERTIYVLYEAKKYGEKAAGVGPDTRIAILSPSLGGEVDQVTLSVIGPSGIAALENMRNSYGMQEIGTSLGLLPHFRRLTPPTSS